jgi:hypothetical protein
VKPIKQLFILFTLFLNTQVFAQQSLITLANKMTTDEIWTALMTPDTKGETKFGKCRIGDATGGKCPSCACNYYFKGARLGSLGYNGWPKNPNSGDGTGCFQWKDGRNACWPGYPSNCSSATAKDLAKAILINALSQSPADVCGLPTKKPVKGSISITDSSKFIFVQPGEECGQKQGQILCATTGQEVNGMVQLIKFDNAQFCKRAYHAARLNNRSSKVIKCADFNKQLLDSQLIANAVVLAGQSAIGFDLSTQAPFIEWIQYNKAQFEAMKTEEVALFYVAVNQNSNILPADIKPRVVLANFNKTSQERGTGNYIIQTEIDAAKIELAKIMKGTVPPKNVSIQDAFKDIQATQMNLQQQ